MLYMDLTKKISVLKDIWQMFEELQKSTEMLFLENFNLVPKMHI